MQLIIAVLVVVTLAIPSRREIYQEPRSIYVAEFVSSSISDQALLAAFTDSFETALINRGPYRVLNRRNLNRLLAEAKSESTLSSLTGVEPGIRKKISGFEGAEGVVFGEVVDDINGGEVRVTVTLETFDAVKRWKRTIAMKRGVVHDGTSRQAAMDQLVSGDLAGSGGNALGTANTDPGLAMTDLRGLKIVMKTASSVKAAGRDFVECQFEFTNYRTANLLVGFNSSSPTVGVSFGPRPIALRANLYDDVGTVWQVPPENLSGLGFVQVGVQAHDQMPYQPADIVSLLSRRDRMGSNTENGWAFVSGNLTSIASGQSVTAVLTFSPTASTGRPTMIRFGGELVIGTVQPNGRPTYELTTVTLNNVPLRTPN